MTTRIYVPARPDQPIPMPGNEPDWPIEGREIDPLSAYHHRLVADGDLILKTKAAKPHADSGAKGATE